MYKADQSKLIGRCVAMPTGTPDGKLMGRLGEMGGTKRLAGNETKWPAELSRVK
jgi:hypothetical protein